jgi:hypothetical protein
MVCPEAGARFYFLCHPRCVAVHITHRVVVAVFLFQPSRHRVRMKVRVVVSAIDWGGLQRTTMSCSARLQLR